MSPLPTQVHPAVAKSLEAWHEMIARRDLGELEAIVHPEAVFRSPMAINAYRPRPALLLALNTVLSIFKDFTYYRQFASAGGEDAGPQGLGDDPETGGGSTPGPKKST